MDDAVFELIGLIAREREGRDRGWWDQMASCYHPDSRVRSMWFTGTGRDFATASRAMTARGDRSRHRLSVPGVHQHGARAVVSMPMAIEFRIALHGVDADLVSYARGIYRLECRDGRYGICNLSAIYERDTLTPVVPGEPIPIDRQLLTTLPAGYRMLAYYFQHRGYQVDPNLPTDDHPESADSVLAEAFDWLGTPTPK
jgi:SnoaL-like domain